MDEIGQRLRRAFDLKPLPSRKKHATSQRNTFSSRRAASLDELGDGQTVPDSMFGGMIDDAIDETTGINKFVQWCIEAIETTGAGLKTKDIYWVTAGQVEAKRISWKAERIMPRVLERETNVHVLTAALKLFFKSLKRPIIRIEDFRLAIQPHLNDVETAELLQQVVYSLPLAERSTLTYLFAHLRRVVDLQENNMTLATLSASFGPTLLRLPTSFTEQASMAKDMKEQNRLVGQLLLHSEVIFGTAETDKATGEEVADETDDGKLDTSSCTSDDVESSSPIMKKSELAESVKKNKTKPITLAMKKRISENKIDSSSSDESETESPLKQRVLVASADNIKRNSTLSANKEKVFRDWITFSSSNDMKKDSPSKKQVRDKITSSSSNDMKTDSLSKKQIRDKITSLSSKDMKTDSLSKKQVLVTIADSKNRSSQSANKESVYREKVGSSSSDEDKPKASVKKRELVASADIYKRDSSVPANKDSVFRDKDGSSSSDEDKPKASVKKRELVAIADIYKRDYSVSAKKDSVFRDKVGSLSSDEDKPKASVKKRELVASADIYKSDSSVSANKDSIFRDKVDSSSSDEDKSKKSSVVKRELVRSPDILKGDSLSANRESYYRYKINSSSSDEDKAKAPVKQNLLASFDDYKGNSFLPAINTVVMSQEKGNSSSSEEIKDDTVKKVKQAKSAKTIIKKIRNKLLQFRLTKNKHKSSTSLNEDERSGSAARNKRMTVHEIDAMSVKITELVPESEVSLVSPTTMTTFQYSSAQLLDSDRNLKSHSGGVAANFTDKKTPDGLIKFKLISSSSSFSSDDDDDKNRSVITSILKKPAGLRNTIGTIHGETTTQLKNYSKTATRIAQPVSATKLTEKGAVAIPQTKLPTAQAQQDSSSKKTSFNPAKKNKLPIANEVIDITENHDAGAESSESLLSSSDDETVKDVLSTSIGTISMDSNHKKEKDSGVKNRTSTSHTSHEEKSHITVSTTDTDFRALSNPSTPNRDMMTETNENAIYATVNKLKPSTLMPPPDIFKPTPTLTEIFNSKSIQSTFYAPPLDSGDQTIGTTVSSNYSLAGKVKNRASTSSSSEESFSSHSSEDSDDNAPNRPPPPPPPPISPQYHSTSITRATGNRIHASVPTVL